jgi:hypothetical protein
MKPGVANQAIMKRNIEMVSIEQEIPLQRGDEPPYYKSPNNRRCYTIPSSSSTKATFCINVIFTYFYVKKNATPFDDLLNNEYSLRIYTFSMVIMNMIGLISALVDINSASNSSYGQVNIHNRKKQIILLLFGFLFVSTTILTPFIAGIIARLVTYNEVCKSFAIEFQGKEGNSDFTFNGDVIGHFTWEDLDNNVVKIGFKANHDVFQKLSPTGLSKMNFLINPNGIAEISGDCYGKLSCFSGNIQFPYKGSLDATITKNGNTKEAYNYPSDWFADAFRIADRSDHSTISQTLFKPFEKDKFKTCSNTFEDAIMAATIAKYGSNGRKCNECILHCHNDYTVNWLIEYSYCSIKCSDSCIGVYSYS